jgi:hypothetical protein
MAYSIAVERTPEPAEEERIARSPVRQNWTFIDMYVMMTIL